MEDVSEAGVVSGECGVIKNTSDQNTNEGNKMNMQRHRTANKKWK